MRVCVIVSHECHEQFCKYTTKNWKTWYNYQKILLLGTQMTTGITRYKPAPHVMPVESG